jgi:hypothetical protein
MTDKISAIPLVRQSRRNSGLYLVCGLLTVVILVIDMSVPLGVAMGVPYVAVVLISLWAPRIRFTVLVAVVASLLTICAFFLKPDVAEMWKAISNRSLALLAIWVTASLGLQRKIAEERREAALRERERALEDVRILRGFLPICASCKKIRDDQGYWTQIEGYIRDHSEADFTNSICPECSKRLYPSLHRKREAST